MGYPTLGGIIGASNWSMNRCLIELDPSDPFVVVCKTNRQAISLVTPQMEFYVGTEIDGPNFDAPIPWTQETSGVYTDGTTYPMRYFFGLSPGIPGAIGNVWAVGSVEGGAIIECVGFQVVDAESFAVAITQEVGVPTVDVTHPALTITKPFSKSMRGVFTELGVAGGVTAADHIGLEGVASSHPLATTVSTGVAGFDPIYAGPTLPFTLAIIGSDEGVGPAIIEVLPIPTPVDETIRLGTPARGPKALAPNVDDGEDVPPLQTMLVHRTSRASAAELDGVGRTFQDQLNEPGSGRVTLDNDDTNLADVGEGDLIRFYVHGRAAWCMLVRQLDRVSLTEDEEHGEVTEISGPGHLAILEEAVVYPARGVGQRPVEEDRVFNWASVDYDDSWWGTATAIALQGAATRYWTGLPDGWPDPDAAWIWASSGDDEWAPDGDCYFRTTFTVPDGVYRARLFFSVDDSGQVYIDGQKIGDTDNEGNDPHLVYEVKGGLDITPGSHTIAVRANNVPDPEGDRIHNPAGVLLSLYACDQNGEITSSSPIVRTDSSWLIVAYPAQPPGMTPGEVMRHCVQEAQDRGALLGLELMFTDDVDSEGVQWPEVTDIATKTGTDCLTFFREITATYTDIWMAPAGMQLYAWAKDTRGEATAVEFHGPTDTDDPDTSNLAHLSHLKVF